MAMLPTLALEDTAVPFMNQIDGGEARWQGLPAAHILCTIRSLTTCQITNDVRAG
jgi:hypothetical protein